MTHLLSSASTNREFTRVNRRLRYRIDAYSGPLDTTTPVAELLRIAFDAKEEDRLDDMVRVLGQVPPIILHGKMEGHSNHPPYRKKTVYRIIGITDNAVVQSLLGPKGGVSQFVRLHKPTIFMHKINNRHITYSLNENFEYVFERSWL